MISNRRKPRGLALRLIVCVVAGAALHLHARAEDPAGPWRTLFRRPAPLLPPAPADNPMTPASIALGARLFADPRLSGSGTRSCASCHRPEFGFTDGRQRAEGLSGAPLRRNTPSLWNLAWSARYFWDGRAPTLEAQVAEPIEAADEMAGHWPVILARLVADGDLAIRLRTAFGAEVSRDRVVKGLAAYVRSLVSPPTRFDAWIAGDTGALGAAEVRGFRLFTGKGGCVLCHVGWRFTDDRFHDIGLPGAGDDIGRGAVPGGTPGLRAFKTPSLRELPHTAPYMHDGSLPTLAAVVDHYAGGFVARPGLAPSLNRSLRLSPQEKADLVAFLLTLATEAKPGP